MIEHPKHLIPVPQLLGHDPQDGDLHLIGGRLFQRQAVLLNRAQLGRGLSADDVAGGVEHVADHVAGALEPLLSGHAAEVDGVRREFSDFREELIGGLGGVVLRPVFQEEVELGEVFLLPVDQRVMVFRGNGLGRVGCQNRPPAERSTFA